MMHIKKLDLHQIVLFIPPNMKLIKFHQIGCSFRAERTVFLCGSNDLYLIM